MKAEEASTHPPVTGSRVGFGTASLHHLTGSRRRLKILESAFEAGIRYYDTAPLYGHESAERLLGRFVRSHRSEGVIAATKVGLVPNGLVTAIPPLLLPYIALRAFSTRLKFVSPSRWEPRRNFSADYLVKRVERSLSLMGLDYLDIVYLHGPRIEELGELQSLTEAAVGLRDRGLVRKFGVSATYDVARWLKQESPQLAAVLQVEVPKEIDTGISEWFAGNAPVTFGHFRILRNKQTDIAKEEYLRYVVQHAVELNPRGTLLFSSTNPSHIIEFVSEVESADRLLMETRHAR